MESNSPFKPDIYPIMYWGLTYGAVAGVLLFIFVILYRFINIFWFPVFLAGLIYGGYRNYRKQKAAWQENTGAPAQPQSPVNEFREAVSDIYSASQEVMNQESEAPPITQEEVIEERVEEMPVSQEPQPNQEEQSLNQPPNPPPIPPIPPA